MLDLFTHWKLSSQVPSENMEFIVRTHLGTSRQESLMSKKEKHNQLCTKPKAPEVTQARDPPVLVRFLCSPPAHSSLHPFLSFCCYRVASFIVSLLFTCSLAVHRDLVHLLHLPLFTGPFPSSPFRFLRDGEQVGPGSPCSGRDFVLSPSYSLLTRPCPDAPIQPAVVGSAECSPRWIPGQKMNFHTRG